MIAENDDDAKNTEAVHKGILQSKFKPTIWASQRVIENQCENLLLILPC